MPNNNLKLIFPTPLWECQIDNAELNDSLKKAIYDVEKSDTKFDTSQYPFGYTSYISKFPLQEDVRFKEITQHVLQEARKFLAAMQIKALDGSILNLRVYDLFCNINRKYSLHVSHRHECSDLSAVYYVVAGKGAANLIAHSPIEPLLMHTRSHFFPNNSPMAQEIQSFTPETGKLLIFPSWMMHEVTQQKTDSERLSLSFNLGIVARPRLAKRK